MATSKDKGTGESARSSGRVTTIKKAVKTDTKMLVSDVSGSYPDDAFEGAYYTGGDFTSVAVIEPQYKPGTLHTLCVQNNILLQCVEAMEVNIDGTGHSIVLVEGGEENEAEKTILEDFFAEPYPGKSMVEIRREIRCDLEECGNGYMEVIRDLSNSVTMLNNLEAACTRLVRLDDPVPATRILRRGGKDIEVSMNVRERRYVQRINGKSIYFKEFGSSRELDRTTGKWSDVPLPLDKKASEVIHFVRTKEPKTPYGVPRWINQLPSVLGSRKAEEHNLEFFDAGGLPPVLVIVQGGTLGEQVTQDLKAHLLGTGNKNRAAIVEAISTSGTLQSAGTVNVRVERFGAERQQDAMFQSYDKACEEHVRCSFRLPPMFIGKAADFNFATAKTAYMVAEAQVFAPERDAFDKIMNTKIVRALGVRSYKYQSLPMTLVDVDNQLKALGIGLDNNIVDKEEVVKSLNEITGLSMVYEEPEEPVLPQGQGVGSLPGSLEDDPTLTPTQGGTKAQNASTGFPEGTPKPPKLRAVKSEMVQLAALWSSVLGLDGPCDLSESMQVAVKKQVDDLSEDDREVMHQILAVKAMKVGSHNVEGVGELCQCVSSLKD